MKERMKNGYFCIIFLLIMFCGITAWDGTCALAEGQENGTAAQVSAVKSEDAQSAESSKDAFAVRIPEEATGFRDNIIHVETAQSGVVTITVTQEDGICRYISSAQVSAGNSEFIWKGTGANGQPLTKGTYQVAIRFVGEDGSVMEQSANCRLTKNEQSLLYAVPSSDTLYLNGEEMWSVDCSFSQAGTAVMDIVSCDDAQTLLARVSQPVKRETNVRLSWNGRMSTSRFVNVGNYRVILYAEGRSENSFSTTLHVQDSNHSHRDGMAIGVTGSILPQRTKSDQEIWEIMMQPSVVYDGTDATYIKEKPSVKSASVGKINPQKQALEVLSVGDDGWTQVRAWRQEDGKRVEGYLLTERLKVAVPDRQYALLVDKQAQMLYVYEYGKRLAAVPVSTGLVRYGQLAWETPAGSYLTGAHLAASGSSGKTYECRIAYDGSRVIEQVGYETVRGFRRYTDTEFLGQANTRGGIAVPVSAEAQVNAWWLYTHLRAGTRIVILDEDVADQMIYEAAGTASTAAAAEIVLTVCGDAEMGSRAYEQNAPEMSFNHFAYMKELFAADDLTVRSLACVIADADEILYSTMTDALRTDSRTTDLLYEAGVQLVTVSNRHFSDYGYRGRVSTLQALNRAGLGVAGAGSVFIFEKDGHRIGLLADREISFLENPEISKKDIDSLKDQGCEVILALCSWGTEDAGWHTIQQKKMAEYLVSAGADVIIGQSGGMQGITEIEGIPVIWNLGKIIVSDEHPVSPYAAAARLALRFSDSGYEGVEISLIPIGVSSSSADGFNNQCPYRMNGSNSQQVLEMMQRKSTLFLQENMWFQARPEDLPE